MIVVVDFPKAWQGEFLRVVQSFIPDIRWTEVTGFSSTDVARFEIISEQGDMDQFTAFFVSFWKVRGCNKFQYITPDKVSRNLRAEGV